MEFPDVETEKKILDVVGLILEEMHGVQSEMDAVPELSRVSSVFDHVRTSVLSLKYRLSNINGDYLRYTSSLKDLDSKIKEIKAIDLEAYRKKSEKDSRSYRAWKDASERITEAERAERNAAAATEKLNAVRAANEAHLAAGLAALKRRSAEMERAASRAVANATRQAKKKAGREARKEVAVLRSEVTALRDEADCLCMERKTLLGRTAALRDLEALQSAHVAKKARALDDLDDEIRRSRAEVDKLAAEAADLTAQVAGWM